MSTASWEEASRCYKCGETGNVIGKTNHPSKPGATVHTLRCDNERCRLYDDIPSLRWSWIIQVDADGSIPVREPRTSEPALSAVPKDMTERVIASLKQNPDEMLEGKAKEIRT